MAEGEIILAMHRLAMFCRQHDLDFPRVKFEFDKIEQADRFDAVIKRDFRLDVMSLSDDRRRINRIAGIAFTICHPGGDL
jgi:hypothetical protein